MSLNLRQFETMTVSINESICNVVLSRPNEGNTINTKMVEEFDLLTNYCAEDKNNISIFVLRASQDIFSLGGDFNRAAKGDEPPDAGLLFDIWHRMTTHGFISISLVEGRVNAGGLGFVAASDIVLAAPSATFALSELLFGLYPACVLPFLCRRIGSQKAHYMSLMTQTIDVPTALSWNLVDQSSDQIELLLRQHLLRLKRLNKRAITSYKSYMNDTQFDLQKHRDKAIRANRLMFTDETIRANIKRYIEELKFPWEI